MEFSYKVSEKQYFQAMKLKLKLGARPRLLKTVMFWVFILVCCILLWTVVQRNSQPTSVPDDQPTQQVDSSQTLRSVAINVGPFVLLGGIWASMLFVLMPKKVRAQFKKDPSMQGRFTVDIAPSGIEMRNTAGTFFTAGWNICEYWREGKDLIILGLHSGTYFILSLADLLEPDRAELREILSVALPKR